MPITALPTAPSRADPDNFSTRADALMAALAAFVTEANALETTVNAKETLATAAGVLAQAALDAGLATAAANASTASAAAASAIAAWDAALLALAGEGLDKQPLDAELTALAGLVSAANTVAYFTGSGTASLASLTAAGRTLIAAADAAAQLVVLGARGQGKETVWIPAGAMTPRITNGPSVGLVETTTNKVMCSTLDFDFGSTDELAQFMVRMPKSWNEGTLTASFSWSNASGTGNVVWGLQAVALSDDDVLDAAFGTAVTVQDAVTAAGDLMQTAETGAMTVAGTPAAGDMVVFQVYRDASDTTNDTLAVDARLHGVTLYYTTDAATDA